MREPIICKGGQNPPKPKLLQRPPAPGGSGAIKSEPDVVMLEILKEIGDAVSGATPGDHDSYVRAVAEVRYYLCAGRQRLGLSED